MASTEEVNNACLGLKAAIKKFWSKYEGRYKKGDKAKIRKQIHECVLHAIWLLKTLSTKRASLLHGVEALKDMWTNSCVPALRRKKLKNLKSILTHALSHYLRLRDGVVLLTSGECRHTGDAPSKQKFKSQLTSNDYRGDGYTKLYSSAQGYTGFGWDEFFDPNLGVQHRLVVLLTKISRKTDVWDKLLEFGAQSFEITLDACYVKDDIANSFKTTLERDVRRLLQELGNGGTIHVVTTDKMERLDVKRPNQPNLTLQRRGNEFQVLDEGGALPNQWTKADWESAMALPSDDNASSVKRKRIIVESSDEEGESNIKETPQHKPTMKLQVKEAKVEQTESTSSSVKAIKNSLGINAAELEKSRETLEAEQNSSEQTITIEVSQNILESQITLKMYRNALRKALKAEDDILEIWSARESLREASMELGIQLLERAKNDDLIKAKALFQEAQTLVLALEKSHHHINEANNDDTETSWLRSRNLILLKARACANHGIAAFYLGEHSKGATRKRFWVEAKEMLDQAIQLSNEMQMYATRDRGKGASAAETTMDSLNAIQLILMANQWKGSVLWKEGNRTRAFETFQAAKSVLGLADKSICQKDNELFVELIKCHVEAYNMYARLADLGVEQVERLKTWKGPETQREGDDLLDMYENAIDSARDVLFAMKKLTEYDDSTTKFENILDDYGLLDPSSLQYQVKQVREWWDSIATMSTKFLDSRGVNTIGNMPRRDLAASDLTLPAPQKRYLISDSRKQLNAQKTKRKPKDYRCEYRGAEGRSYSEKPAQVKSYRRWGDQLLKPRMHDNTERISDFDHPAVVPPLPPGFPPPAIA